MCVNHGARCDLAIAASAAVGLERGVPLLDIDGRELLHKSGTDVWDDLPVEQLAVALRRPGRDRLRGLPVIDPCLDVLCHGQLLRLDVVGMLQTAAREDWPA